MAILKNTTINDTGYLKLASGTIAQRVGSNAGETRYNSETGNFEGYGSAGWHVLSPVNMKVTNVTLVSGATYIVGTGLQINPSVSSVFTITGFNFAAGSTVLLDSTEITSGVVVNSPTLITVTTGTGNLTSGTYSNVVVRNPYGQTASFAYPVIVAGGPQFSTATNIGTFTEGTISTSVAASSPGGTVTYSANAVSGNGGSGYGLPAGLSISSSGAITGTLVVTGTTTYNLTIKATDNSSRTASKDFTLTVSDAAVPVITSPAAGSLGTITALPYTLWGATYAAGSGFSGITNTFSPTGVNTPPSSTSISTIVSSNPSSATIVYRISSGSLPQGITLNGSTGVISGTVTIGAKQAASSVYNFGIKSVDSLNNESLENQYSLTVTIPYLYRQILTTGYITAGYKNGVQWKNVNRLVMSTETTVDLGDRLTYAHNYKGGSCSADKQYGFQCQADGGNSTPGVKTIIFNMRTEVGTTGPDYAYSGSRGGAVARNDGFQDYAYFTGGFTGANADNIGKYAFSTDTWVSFSTKTGQTGSGEITYCSDELYGLWSIGTADTTSYTKKFLYSSETVSDYGIAVVGGSQMKNLQSKYGAVYAGVGTGYGDSTTVAQGVDWRKTIFATQEQFTFNRGYSGNNTGIAGNFAEEITIMGQDRGWCIGVYDSQQNNSGVRLIYAVDVSTILPYSTNRKGTPGSSSGLGGWRD